MRALAILTLLIVAHGAAMADVIPVESRVTAVHLFKNGLAVVHRSLDVPGEGTFRVEDLPPPIHGSFWIQSAAPVLARSTVEDVEVTRDEYAPSQLQQDLAGRQVTIYFKDGTVPAVTGTVVRSARQPSNRLPLPGTAGVPVPQENFLILEVGADRTYVDASMIAYVNVRNAGNTVLEQRPVLLLDVPKEATGPISISYLARGLSWAPSYRIDITDPASLTIQQQAIIKNELEDFTDAEVSLISGFPSIEFERVTSPLSLQQTWQDYSQQLQYREDPRGPHAAVAQQMILSNASANIMYPDFALGAGVEPEGQGADIHYEPVGTRSVNKGDALMVEVARGSTDYRRRIEWTQTDTRAADNWLQNRSNSGWRSGNENAAWEVIAFNNPLPFPMTTGPALVVAEDKMLGQNMCYWANSGEPTVVRITKALSIRTMSEEHEVADTREQVVIGGRNYERTTVEGSVRVRNQRAETVEMVIRRQFSGALIEAEGEPKTELTEEGAWSLNQQNELTWTIQLAPAEERTLTFKYTVLVSR